MALKYEHLSDDELDAINNPVPVSGPSKEDVIRQIESDHARAVKEAKGKTGDEKARYDADIAALEERHAAVKAAPQGQVKKVYDDHVTESRRKGARA